MKRTDLIERLKKLAPALSTKEFVPILSCFCFGKTSVHAYDDVIALELPYGGEFQLPIRGGLRGKLLLDFLSASKATEVEFLNPSGEKVDHTYTGELHCKAGRSKLKIPLQTETEFVFSLPPADAAHTINIGRDFIDRLKMAMPSMGENPSTPWQYGVTIFFGRKSIALYATDNKVASSVRVWIAPAEALQGQVTIMPPRFCDLLVEISGKDEPVKLVLTDQWVTAYFKSGLTLFSKAVAGANVIEYQTIFKAANEQSQDAVEVPLGFERCVDRALVVLPYAGETPFTDFSVGAGRLSMKTLSRAGEANDEIGLEGHPDVEVKANPDNLKKHLANVTHLRLVKDSFVVLLGEGVSHLVTAVAE
jgi:DNA polymerase III sliding clamp (beta) subunit (PCNA family)